MSNQTSDANQLIDFVLNYETAWFGDPPEEIQTALNQLFSLGDAVVPSIAGRLDLCNRGECRGRHWWLGSIELCRLLSRLGTQRARDALMTVVKTEGLTMDFDYIRAEAAKQLAFFSDPRLVSELTECLSLPNAPVAEINNTIQALGGVGTSKLPAAAPAPATTPAPAARTSKPGSLFDTLKNKIKSVRPKKPNRPLLQRMKPYWWAGVMAVVLAALMFTGNWSAISLVFGFVMIIAGIGLLIAVFGKKPAWKTWLAVLGICVLVLCLAYKYDTPLKAVPAALERGTRVPAIAIEPKYIEGTKDTARLLVDPKAAAETRPASLSLAAGQEFLVVRLDITPNKDNIVKYCGSFSGDASTLIDKEGKKYPVVYWVNTGLQFPRGLENEWGLKQVYQADNAWLGDYQLNGSTRATLVFQVPSNSIPESLELRFAYVNNHDKKGKTESGIKIVNLKEVNSTRYE